MFDTALQLLSDYFGKSFLISFFFPSLFFWMLNLALAVLSAGLDKVLAWWGKQDGQVQTFLIAAFLVWIVLTAYVMRIFMGELTRLYEGRWGLLTWLTRPMRRRNEKKWKKLCERDEALGAQILALKARHTTLKELLNREDVPYLPYGTKVDISATAKEAGALYDRVQGWKVDDYLDDAKWAEMLKQLDSLQVRIFSLSADEVKQHQDKIGAGSKADLIFRATEEFLNNLIGKLEKEELEIFQERTETFPARLNWIMPTRLGNYLRASETYSYLRYNLDAAVIWPRLRETLEDTFAGRLGDAKTNMDLMLVLTTLASIFGAAWGIILVAVPDHLLAVQKLIAAPIAFVSGLIIARITYLNAAEGAQAYGELFKTAFDLYRWNLLKALHFDLPADLDSEKELWGEIGELFYRNYPLKKRWTHPPLKPEPAAKTDKT